MNVICMENSAKNWGDLLGSLGYTDESQFDIVIGSIYPVYAMCLWGGALLYLLEVHNERPAWYPAILFEVRDPSVPASWHFAFWGRDRSNQITAIWGYDELINNEGHFDALSELEQDAIQIFLEKKGIMG